MKRVLQICLILGWLVILLCVPATAEQIRLKSGKVIEGNIVEETDRSIKINSGGRTFVIKKKMIADDNAPSNTPIDFNELPPIDVYLTNWCPHCKSLEVFLNQNKIKYNRYNTDFEINAKKKELAGGGKGRLGIPFTVIGPYTVEGNRPKSIVYYLKQYQRDLQRK